VPKASVTKKKTLSSTNAVGLLLIPESPVTSNPTLLNLTL
jgi:hypothetical protein